MKMVLVDEGGGRRSLGGGQLEAAKPSHLFLTSDCARGREAAGGQLPWRLFPHFHARYYLRKVLVSRSSSKQEAQDVS